MKKRVLIFCSVVIVVAGLFLLLRKEGRTPTVQPSAQGPVREISLAEPAAPVTLQPTDEVLKVLSQDETPRKVQLEMPYIHETPDHVWTGPWKNGCEEASIAIVEQYYTGKKTITTAEAKQYMSILFDVQNATWGSNANSDAARTVELINTVTSYRATIHDAPTTEEIKKELREGRPVISLHYGFDLHNDNIPFLATGSAYHMMVIVGYDDNAQEFIVHDTGDTVQGPNHRYNYELFMRSLHDYNYTTKKADGPPRVLFTRVK